MKAKTLEIFIVDDDVDFAEGLGDLLEADGHQITLAHSGPEAIRIFQQRSFDITFMDIKMPVMNGVDTLKKLRQISPQAKVVMMTGYSVDRLLKEAIVQGALGRLQKPIDMDRLATMLARAQADGIILVVDDDRDFTSSIRDLLEAEGYSVISARTGEEALATAQTDGIDILVLDINLPVINGLDVLENLIQQGRRLPTVVVTAHPKDSEQIKAVTALPALQYLTKPFDPDDLLNVLHSLKLRQTG